MYVYKGKYIHDDNGLWGKIFLHKTQYNNSKAGIQNNFLVFLKKIG